MKRNYLLPFVLVPVFCALFLQAKKEKPAIEETNAKRVESYTSHYSILPELWRHVYHASRLQVYKIHDKIEGTVENLRKEKDGDYHIQIRLDAPYNDKLNAKNREKQNGCLVIEIMCYNNVTQADAIDACKKCPVMDPPKVGNHITVYGSFINDTENGHGWNEIHPVSDITYD